MVPKAPIVLGVLCVVILIIGAIGENFSQEFSEFMEATPSHNKLKTDSKIIFEINELALKYQENNDDKKINEQRILMEEKIVEIARDSFGADSITQLEILPAYFPFVKGSQVDMRGNEKTFPICDVAENIPVHLQKITDAEMFQRFLKKYSKNEIVLNIQDERFAKSSFHYGLQAISDDGKFVASTFFHADSCTNEITDFDKFHLSCLDKEKKEWTGGTTNPDYIRASIELDEFCVIPLSPWHQLVSEYQDTISDKIDEKHEIMSDVEIRSLVDAMRFQSEIEQWVLLSNIAGNIVHDYLEDEKTQNMIREYNEKYGDLPDELLELLDEKPSLPESNKEEENSQILSEINQLGLKYQENGEDEKFNEKMLLMQEKQKEITTDILGVKISNVYIKENWNFPFKDSSKVNILNTENIVPLCNIPEKIPDHLKIIRQTEMFQMISEKYSEDIIMIDISDERSSGGWIHYDFSVTSSDSNETQQMNTHFHLDSCTGEKIPPDVLMCKNQGDEKSRTHTQIKSEINASLKNYDEFCVIEYGDWHQRLNKYQQEIQKEMRLQDQKLSEIDSDENQNRYDEFGYKFTRDLSLGLENNILNDLSANPYDFDENSEDLSKYKKRFGELPQILSELIVQRPSE